MAKTVLRKFMRLQDGTGSSTLAMRTGSSTCGIDLNARITRTVLPPKIVMCLKKRQFISPKRHAASLFLEPSFLCQQKTTQPTR